MKTTLVNTLSAIALTGLALTLAPTSASAHGSSLDHGDRNFGKGKGCNTRPSHTCNSLPHGCRKVNYHGESCWFGGGHYYRCNPIGGYVIIDAEPTVEVETQIVAAPVVETTYAYEEEDAVSVSVLPSDCEVVYLGGERCWYHDGCYFRKCGHGYKKWNCKDKDHGHGHDHGKVCKNDRHNDKNSSRNSKQCKTSSRHDTVKVGHKDSGKGGSKSTGGKSGGGKSSGGHGRH